MFVVRRNCIKLSSFKDVIQHMRNRSTIATPIKLKGHESQAGKYLLLVLPVSTFALGCWQVQRRTWKLNLIDDMQKRLSQPAVPLPQDLQELEDYEYRKVVVKGKFDYTREVFIGPRSLVEPEDTKKPPSLLQPAKPSTTGVWVVTPFTLSDRDITILVNRGWVPISHMDPSKRAAGNTDKEVTLTGIVRLSEKRAPFESKELSEGPMFQRRDVHMMAYLLNTAPVFIDACRESTIPGGPVGGQTRVNLRNEHFSYILTWYSLSALTLFMWYQKFFKRVGRI